MSLKFEAKTDWTGMGTLLARIKSADDAGASAMADVILKGAKRDITVDTGRAQRSGYKRRNKLGSYTVVFGRGAKYVALLHDDLSLNLRNGMSKFLSRQVEAANKLMSAATKAMKRKLGV